jgi:hypothetical protein
MGETALSALTQYRARATVRLDDSARPNTRVSDLINAFRVTESEAGLSALELRLVNQASPEGGGNEVLALEDERDVKLGTKIKLFCGDENRPREVFRGVVSGIEAEFPQDGPPELLLLVEDPLHKVRLARRTKVHDHLRLKSLVESLAKDMSLTPKISGLTEDLGTYVQLNESDLAFLRRLLARNDADLQVVGTELHVSPRKDVQRGAVELAWNSQLYRARFCADLSDQVTEVTTSGWDVKNGTRVAGSSFGANLGPGTGRLASRILPGVFGARSEHVGNPTVTTTDEARALADAAFDQRARRFVRVEGTAEGNALIRVGSHVRLTGMSRRFNNTYYVRHACHRFQKTTGQYETDFQAESAYLGNA